MYVVTRFHTIRSASIQLVLSRSLVLFFFFFNDPAPTEIYPLPLPAALPICRHVPAHGAREIARAARSRRPAPRGRETRRMSLGPLMIDLAGTSVTAEDRELLHHPLVGGVILFTRNYTDPAQLTALASAIHAARTPPLIVAVDQEGGRVQRFREGFSVLPPARRLGHEFDLDASAGLALSRAMGWLMAAELRAHGVDISFAPCVDLDHGVSIIGDRAFHSQSEEVATLSPALMHSMSDAGMAAPAKHHPR